MTDLQEKAMRTALERLESHEYWMDEDAIQALRQALAQPKQEPAMWVTPDGNGFRLRLNPPINDVPLGWEPLYTAPPKREWVGLTKADKQEAFDETQEASGGFWEFADYLDAKLKEKNT